MKKLLFTLTLMLACQLVFGQEARNVFDRYKNKREARYVSVPRAMTSAMAGKMKDNNVQEVMRDVKSVQVLRLNDCRRSVRRGFAKRVARLSSKGYQELTRMKGRRDDLLVLARQGGRYVEEVVLLVSNRRDCMGILVTGEIDPKDVEAVVSMASDY